MVWGEIPFIGEKTPESVVEIVVGFVAGIIFDYGYNEPGADMPAIPLVATSILPAFPSALYAAIFPSTHTLPRPTFTDPALWNLS
jgi:hypothetical protein